MLIAVTIVVAALKWLLPKALARIQRRIDPHPGSSLRVEETAAIGAGALWVVNVRGRTFLLGSTANGVSCLADLTETAPAEPVFLDAMDEALARPIPTATAVAAPNTDADRRQEALRRLERLAHDR
jgi:flagellar biogenesis protein FliO